MVLWYWTGHINLLTTVWFQGSCFSHVQEIFTGYHGCRDQTRPLPSESLQSSWNSQANGQSQHRSLSISLSFQGSWDSALGSPRSSLSYKLPTLISMMYFLYAKWVVLNFEGTSFMVPPSLCPHPSGTMRHILSHRSPASKILLDLTQLQLLPGEAERRIWLFFFLC